MRRAVVTLLALLIGFGLAGCGGGGGNGGNGGGSGQVAGRWRQVSHQEGGTTHTCPVVPYCGDSDTLELRSDGSFSGRVARNSEPETVITEGTWEREGDTLRLRYLTGGTDRNGDGDYLDPEDRPSMADPYTLEFPISVSGSTLSLRFDTDFDGAPDATVRFNRM